MPLDKNIKKVLVIGSGPIVVGQAAEFDYAGTQACRVLQAEKVEARPHHLLQKVSGRTGRLCGRFRGAVGADRWGVDGAVGCRYKTDFLWDIFFFLLSVQSVVSVNGGYL